MHHSEGHKKNGMLSQTRRQNKIMKNIQRYAASSIS
jgi:hypothetical protein